LRAFEPFARLSQKVALLSPESGQVVPLQDVRCGGRGRARAASARLAAVSGQGVGDALAGGGGLAVDAVGVDLEQDGDAVSGAGGIRSLWVPITLSQPLAWLFSVG
jgi:hypothetical protein